jgi:hypothetical protein
MSTQVTLNGRLTKDPEVFFWPRADKNGLVPEHRPELGQCWVWTPRPARYGHVEVDGETHLVHRLSWQMANGQIPDDKPYVLHRCDNMSCVRPSHLFVGTAEDNTRDMLAKGRWDGGRPREGNHENEAHVCVACGRRRRDKGRGLCGGCYENNRTAGTLNHYPLRRKAAA